MKMIPILVALVCVLSNAVTAQLAGPLGMTTAQSNFSQYLLKSASANIDNSNTDGTVNSFNNRENTTGTRFLFDTWVNGGKVVNMQDEPVNTTSFLFNIDKLTSNLLVTQNKKEIMAVAPTGIKSFVLENRGKQYPFEHVNAIDSLKFFLKLSDNDSLYALYKECRVKFIKSNFRDDGMIQSGNPDDEYADESKYYIIKRGSSSSRLITLKSKDIRNALVSEKEKVNDYFDAHRDNLGSENFLVGLVNHINGQ